MAYTQANQKTGGVPQAVVIFSTGLKPDTRLQVFNTHFHVHSSALKLHSAFFAPSCTPPTKLEAILDFQYEWITKVYEDGSWALICGNTEEFCVMFSRLIVTTANKQTIPKT
jgi:hypothetical protein